MQTLLLLSSALLAGSGLSLLSGDAKSGSQLWATPGNPRKLRVAIINNAAPELALKQGPPTHLFNGNYTSKPCDCDSNLPPCVPRVR